MPDAVVEIDYRIGGDRDLGEAQWRKAGRGASEYAKGMSDVERRAREADRAVEGMAETAGRAARRAQNDYIRSTRGFTGRSGGYISENFAAMGVPVPDEQALRHTQNQMEAMRRYYQRQQTQTPSAVRTREVLGTVRSQQLEARRHAARPNVSLAAINESYRQRERVEQARARQVRFDAIQDQQSQESRERADLASRRAAGDRFRFVQASERHAAERRAMFGPNEVGSSDIAALAGGSAERRLTTGTVYRWQGQSPKAPLMPRIGRFGSGLASVGNMLGVGAISGAVYSWQQSQQDFRERADRSAEEFDTLSRSLAVQAGFRDGEMPKARRRIDDLAFRAAATKDFAYSTSTQLVSSGFAADEATGPALREMLKGANAMPAPGGRRVDPVALAEAAASYMHSQNMDLTGENLRNVLAGVQNLYKSTNFQLTDFSQLAGQADTMRGKMTMGEQFAAFSVLRDVGDNAEESTTALRNIAIRAQTTAGSDEKVKALESLGLKPTDIDMVGESFITVLDRLAKAIEGKSPEAVTTSLEKVFGERTLSGLLRLIEDRGKVKDRATAIGDVGKYEADAELMSSGPAAAKRRQEMQSEKFAEEHSQKDNLLREELGQQALERGESPFRVEARKAQYDLYRGAGIDRDKAAAAAFGDYGLGVGGLDRVSAAKRSLTEKGIVIDPAITDPLRDQAIKDWQSRHPGQPWIASDPFDRTGKGTIGKPTNVIPRDDAAIRAENERFIQEQAEQRTAGVLPAPRPTGGHQRDANEKLLTEIRDAIRDQQPVVVIKGNDRRPPVNLPLLMLGAGPLTR